MRQIFLIDTFGQRPSYMLGKLFADFSFSNRSKPRKCQVNSIETDVYLRFIRLSSLMTAERFFFKSLIFFLYKFLHQT